MYQYVSKCNYRILPLVDQDALQLSVTVLCINKGNLISSVLCSEMKNEMDPSVTVDSFISIGRWRFMCYISRTDSTLCSWDLEAVTSTPCAPAKIIPDKPVGDSSLRAIVRQQRGARSPSSLPLPSSPSCWRAIHQHYKSSWCAATLPSREMPRQGPGTSPLGSVKFTPQQMHWERIGLGEMLKALFTQWVV
jgi:hypothetical protein